MAEIKSIIVLYGGASSERDISLESGKGIYEALDQLGYFVTLKDFNNLEKLEDLKKYDLVFIALHGFEGESGILQKDLDNLGILYTGSKYLSCKNTWNISAKNTAWCLLGCAIGDFGTILFFQLTNIPFPVLGIMALAIINGLITSIILETIILMRQKLSFLKAFIAALIGSDTLAPGLALRIFFLTTLLPEAIVPDVQP